MCATTFLRARTAIFMNAVESRAVAGWLLRKRGVRKALGLPLWGVLAGAALALCSSPSCAFAQQYFSAAEIRSADPGTESSGQPTAEAGGSANVVGTVTDGSGSSVPGAEVCLLQEGATQPRKTIAQADGEFSFTKLLPGSYTVIVTAENFAPFTSAEFALANGQIYDVPDVLLTVASQNTEVTVHPAEFVAAEQIRAAEKQRLLGVIPNFYTSYIGDAAPLTAKQKFSFAVRGTFDPVSMLGVGFGAGIEQATDSFAGYGQGASGYAKRYAAKFADGRSSDFLTHAIFPSIFHQDPRYFYQGSGSFKSRLAHAVGSAFFTRRDNGFTQPNYSYLLGDVSSAALSNLYYPRANRGVSLVFTNAAVGLAGRIGGNVLREFTKRVTTNTPERIQ